LVSIVKSPTLDSIKHNVFDSLRRDDENLGFRKSWNKAKALSRPASLKWTFTEISLKRQDTSL